VYMILKNLPKYWIKNGQPEIGDIFLLLRNKTYHYAVLTNLNRDSKFWQFWWTDFCSLDTVPPEYTRWILKKDQLAGKPFTLGRDRLCAIPLSFPLGPTVDIALETFRELHVDTKPKAKVIDLMPHLKDKK